MKVIAINGSPHKEGNNFFALSVIGKVFHQNNIDFEIIHVGHKNIRGCMACNKCYKNMNEKCIFSEDILNETVQLMKSADGIILSSPVFYSGIAGTMKSFLDRAFYVSDANGNLFRHKVGASVVTVRRSGGTITFDNLNHYLNYAEMLIPSSNYWNVIHGHRAEDSSKDEEGIQILQTLAGNMAWLLKIRENSVPGPKRINKILTNFIR